MTTDVTGILGGTALLHSASAEDLSAVAAASRLRNFRAARSCLPGTIRATP